MKKLLFIAVIAFVSCQHDKTPPADTTPEWKLPYSVTKQTVTHTRIRGIAGSRRILVSKQGDNGTMIIGGVNPGDTLVLRSSLNPWSYIYIGNVKGTKENPVVVINEGIVQTSAGFNLQNCEYLHITGIGGGSDRGFLINQHVKTDTDGGGPILSIEKRSSHIEFDHFVGDSAQYGIWMKNEHFVEDTTLTSWVLDGLKVHDGEMKHLRQHGSYIGATEIKNKTRPVNINGKDYYFDPSRIGNVEIYNMYIHNVGKNGLMVSDARVGKSSIHDNIIDSTGNQMQQDQGTGIAIGGASVMEVYNNKVSNTWLWGIAAFGGKISIHNNTVTRSGYNAASKTELGWAENIRSTVDPNVPYPVTIEISNNILSQPGKGSKPIAIYKGNYASSGNKLCNNGSGEVLNEGVVFDSCTDTPPTPPAPKPAEVFKKGYFVLNGKRFYYTLYTDSTWKNLK